MVRTRLPLSVALLCATGLGLLCVATPASAQFGIPGINNAVRMFNDATRGTKPGGHVSRGKNSSSSSSSDEGDEDSRHGKKNEKADQEASARIAKQLAAMEAELADISRAQRMERERNVDMAVKEFIAALAEGHDSLLRQPDRGVRATRGEINQVTAGQVVSSIGEAYDKANLREFEKYTGELWTRDRLLVRILHYATKGLRPYFEGVGAKGPAMEDLKDLFQKSAREVFAKALETTEIIGVSKSFDRFIRTIYEQSDDANPGLWTTGADGKYERLTSLTIEAFWQGGYGDKGSEAVVADTEGLDRQFLYRFRARRALYECLSLTYPELVRGGPGTMTTSITTTTVIPSRRGLQPLGPTLTPVDEEALWSRVRAHLVKSCQGTMPTILAKAKSGAIQPVSSRDSGLPTGSLLPAGERQ